MSLTTALSHAQPDDEESARIAAWALRRLGDTLADSDLPSDLARTLALTEPVLHELEETIRRAAEATAGASTGLEAAVAADLLGQAGAATVQVRLRIERIATQLRGYGLEFPDASTRLAARATTQRIITAPDQPLAHTAMPAVAAGTASMVRR